MTREQAIELARRHAVRTGDAPYHNYQPTPETARNWQPHEWVVEALMECDLPAREGVSPQTQFDGRYGGL